MQNQELEQLFIQTADQPELFSAFLNQLLVSEVFCLGDDSDQSNLQFRTMETPDGEQAIPFFLTLDTLRMSLGDDLHYFLLPAKQLLEITKGSTLLLNPASSYMKEFSPEEIELLCTVS
ncbi:SseB family protein [Acinetobacter stercoris]|uniref:Enhanced serine sensitivity protein SseB n=1 Tax=Acinetobacter stercoris TaxID=2126983 RepID=A0A2U3N3I7_9GAMM|nr:SseB family protein [Acinetobacter stercoris]SPL72246.1 enhanced serine sensitivity protein SseB [Acinetobacter stercoris]